MYCNACGHNNPENAKFCSKCAAVLEMKVPVVERGFDSSPAAIRRSRVGTLIGLAAMAIGLGILAILFVQLRNGNGRPKESSSSSQDTPSPTTPPSGSSNDGDNARSAAADSDSVNQPTEADTDGPGAAAMRLIHGIGVSEDCARGMRLLTAEADHNVGARRLLAIEYIDGNDCTSRDYVYAMKVLVTTPEPIKNDSEVTAEMVNVLRSIMPPSEEERTSKFTAAEWMAVQPSSVATQDPFKLSFLAASTLCGGLREKIKKQGDEPLGEPVGLKLPTTRTCCCNAPHATKRQIGPRLTAAKGFLACIPRSHIRLQMASAPSAKPVI